MSEKVVIVGAGQAGLQVAASLRQGGFTGQVVLLGKEHRLPYQRPPLSKQVLKDGWPPEKCSLRQQAFLDTNAIEFRPGTVATGLDAPGGRITLEDGDSVSYQHLVICTGSRLRRLSLNDHEPAGMNYLRTLDHALALRDELKLGVRLVIVGGGYIGLEVAASARALGCEVDVIEAQAHIMQRSALAPIADFLLARHLAEGVGMHLGRLVSGVEGNKRVESISLDGGTLIQADVVLKAIGVQPELRWLQDSGIELGRGVRVDSRCRTNLVNVLAAGDCAETMHPLYKEPLVLESVQNAVDQGKTAAATILGNDSEYTEAPWFWSEQYDCRFQMAGIPQPGDELVIRKGNPGTVSVLSLGSSRLNAIQCVNAPKDYMCGRKLIALRDEIHPDRLRDPAVDLKALL